LDGRSRHDATSAIEGVHRYNTHQQVSVKCAAHSNRSRYSDRSIVCVCAVKVSTESRLSVEDLCHVVVHA
jgi:hypothetical protein